MLLVGHGLLGSGVAAFARDVLTANIDWTDTGRAIAGLTKLATGLDLGSADSWTVLWCAGASTMRSTSETMHRETAYLGAFLEALTRTVNRTQSSERGVVFLASSAGGIYGRGSSATISERDPIAPVTEYSKGKLAQEQHLHRFHELTDTRCLIGRISNLYGSSQDLGKSQGLISHVCSAAIRRTPLTVTVPLDTRRDYVHTLDAGKRILAWIELSRRRVPSITTKLVVSGRSATVAEIITDVRRVSRLRPRVVYAQVDPRSNSPRYQSFRSVVDAHVDELTPCRSLESGVHEVWRETWRRFVRPPPA